MKIGRHSSYAKTLLLWISLSCALLGCTSKSTISYQDMPMSEFIIGTWRVISIVNADTGETLEIQAPTVFISENELSYGDVIGAEYSFIEEDLMFVDNKRLKGGETWRLEKDGENLLVHQEFQGFRSTTTLERVTR
ncbi:MAG TPA: hypothetical protein VK206_26215 [Anaerolineales bacterium]|nr:hypothetical protein [Anaerolineales bacterium]